MEVEKRTKNISLRNSNMQGMCKEKEGNGGQHEGKFGKVEKGPEI